MKKDMSRKSAINIFLPRKVFDLLHGVNLGLLF